MGSLVTSDVVLVGVGCLLAAADDLALVLDPLVELADLGLTLIAVGIEGDLGQLGTLRASSSRSASCRCPPRPIRLSKSPRSVSPLGHELGPLRLTPGLALLVQLVEQRRSRCRCEA